MRWRTLGMSRVWGCGRRVILSGRSKRERECVFPAAQSCPRASSSCSTISSISARRSRSSSAWAPGPRTSRGGCHRVEAVRPNRRDAFGESGGEPIACERSSRRFQPTRDEASRGEPSDHPVPPAFSRQASDRNPDILPGDLLLDLGIASPGSCPPA